MEIKNITENREKELAKLNIASLKKYAKDLGIQEIGRVKKEIIQII